VGFLLVSFHSILANIFPLDFSKLNILKSFSFGRISTMMMGIQITAPRFLRRGFSFSSAVQNATRGFSSTAQSGDWMPVDVSADGRVATVRLQSGGANVLTMDAVTELRKVWASLEAPDSGIDAVILTSAKTGVVRNERGG
jgi:hypothetical protein